MGRAKRPKSRPLTYLEVLDAEDWHLCGGHGLLDPAQHGHRDDYRHAMERVEKATKAARGRSTPELAQAIADLDAKEAVYRKLVRARLHSAGRSALCLSGGGIRSATFGLGVLQGLASKSKRDEKGFKLLGEFDYLSTVSGGGYLGGWLSAWIAREGLSPVLTQLSQIPESTLDPEPSAVRHLRKFSNYLSPNLGATSADTWALVSTVGRNMALNWLVLLPLFAGVLLLPLFAWRAADHQEAPNILRYLVMWTGVVSAAVATAYVGFDLPSGGDLKRSHRRYLFLCLGMLMLSAACLNVFWAWLPVQGWDGPWWDFVRLGKSGLDWRQLAIGAAVIHGGGMLVGMLGANLLYKRPTRLRGLMAALTAAVTGAFGGAATSLMIQHVPYDPQTGAVTYSQAYAWLAYPAVMIFFMTAGALLVGFSSYQTNDEDREWWARSGGWMLALTVVWFALAGLVLYAPDLLQWVNAELSAKFTALTGLTGWAAARVASSQATPAGGSSESQEGLKKVVAYPFLQAAATAILLPLFLVLLILLLSAWNFSLLTEFHQWRLPGSREKFVSIEVLGLGLLYAAICLVSSWFINVNKFSLHSMYRQRLIRAYLGATNRNRTPHPFTGFDESDNISMYKLARKPFHVVNMTLNLVGGDNLAWQQRKAAPYTSTRLHTGSCRLGYRPSRQYGGRYRLSRTPISLGTAMTISGAAASPNMGYNSSPLLTAVMMLFNARLGWWLGNPRDGDRSVWSKPGPNWGLRAFVDETFGLTNEKNAWVYLSDGAHFENLGLYEMVARRCHTIVVCDAGADPTYSYEDLGNAVRKIRVDLGIPIDFDPPRMPMSPAQLPTPSQSAHHCAVATIRYSAVDGHAPDGTLVYIKPSLSGDEPPDVNHYASTDSRFPHQPTPDQFFDEPQFESYRRLGLHTVEQISRSSTQMDLAEFVAAAKAYRNERP